MKNVVLFVLFFCAVSVGANSELFSQSEIIVKLNPSLKLRSLLQANILLSSFGVRSSESLNTESQVLKLNLSTNTYKELNKVINQLKQSGLVAYAEPNYRYRLDVDDDEEVGEGISTEPLFEQQWGMHNVGQEDDVELDEESKSYGIEDVDVDMPEAWELSTGSKNVVVALLDTGVDYNHKDLADNLWSHPNDSRVVGYNAFDDNMNPFDGHSHGTHCAGTIGANTNNGLGISGINQNVSIMPVKIFSDSGSTSVDIIVKGIDWAVNNGAHILSNSWGGGRFSDAIKDAITRADEAGALFVASSGNFAADTDKSPHYPSGYDVPNVVSVAAHNNRNAISGVSNYGKTTVDLMAPGKNVLSTLPDDKYGTKSGTSMAAPFVAGAAALLMAAEPELTYLEVKERLLATTDKVFAYKNKLATKGGRLNINNLLRNIRPPALADVPSDQWDRFVGKPMSSAHPYENDAVVEWVVQHKGAKFLRLKFSKIELEERYDRITITDYEGKVVEEITGAHEGEYLTDSIQGDKVTIRFSADYMVTKYGFDFAGYEVSSWEQAK